jgi:hypothetical protein
MIVSRQRSDKEQIYLISGVIFSAMLIVLHKYAFQKSYYTYILDALSVALSIFATSAAIYAYNKKRRYGKAESESFLWLSIGLGMWAAAELSWAFYEVVLGIIGPPLSVADIFWTLGYIPFAYAIYLVLKSTKWGNQSRKIVSVSFVLIATVSYLFLRNDIVSTEEPFLTNFINMLYIIGDIAFLSVGVPITIEFIFASISNSFIFTSLAILLFSIGDMAYFKLAAAGEYATGNITFIFYILGYLWIGLASLIYAAENERKQ